MGHWFVGTNRIVGYLHASFVVRGVALDCPILRDSLPVISIRSAEVESPERQHVQIEGSLLVQRTDLTAEEEIVVLLHYAGQSGFSRKELGLHAKCSASSVTNALTKLQSSAIREVISVAGRYRLTDMGSKRVREKLADKLLLD